MSSVIVVFVVWFAIIAVLGLFAIAIAPRLRAPAWLRAGLSRAGKAVDASNASTGRVTTGVVLGLAMWSVVIILGWLLGLAAHHLQGSIDWPAFHWWQNHHLTGTWSHAWRKLTNVGAPRVIQGMTLGGAVLTVLLYLRRPFWWAPAATIVVGYFAERQSQIILKLVVDRGHPPTTLGTWPSGGMGRLIVVYGLIIYFVVKRFWSHSPRMWAVGWTLLAICASVQAYARLNNLEHWTTDVVGGALYGMSLLLMMIITYGPLSRLRAISEPTPDSVALPRERVPQQVG